MEHIRRSPANHRGSKWGSGGYPVVHHAIVPGIGIEERKIWPWFWIFSGGRQLDSGLGWGMD
ncbi:hypothetical protein Mapa_000122 [Marchantia paleacea]|nr:hypothetical protein Mapa_000122 [Marchantia paleacea]